jgi:hypothetical protein
MGSRTPDVDAFIEDGFVCIRGAFPRAVADACRALLWNEIAASPNDPSTWTQPVVRVVNMTQAPFVEAANTPVLHEAFDQLVGSGRWQPRPGIGGIPIRFPHAEDPGDTGWHIDAGFAPPHDPETVDYQHWRSNLWSDGRALLMLFLFSDVTENDAPTRIRIGSHLRMPKVLEPHGRTGTTSFLDYSITDDLPQAVATGDAGDVYLCHPFLVHAAQMNIDGSPRFMGQPPLHLVEGIGYELDGPSPVEQAIRLGLDRSQRSRRRYT